MKPCGSCGAAMIWATTIAGKKMPVDAVPLAEVPPSNQGVFVLLRTGDAPLAIPLVGVNALSLEAASLHRVPLFVSHFATCPQAGEHRR